MYFAYQVKFELKFYFIVRARDRNQIASNTLRENICETDAVKRLKAG